ncbi:MAG: hypothetical protein J7647_16370 [Cyanobacteria bacterium SBLK]|nr:hypothetical protein [Cyanobacteria bacterium SBLK]
MALAIAKLVQTLRITLNLIKITWQLQHSFGRVWNFSKTAIAQCKIRKRDRPLSFPGCN